jgi:hypothetical protein
VIRILCWLSVLATSILLSFSQQAEARDVVSATAFAGDQLVYRLSHDQLMAQASTPFEKRFEIITPDIDKTSSANLVAMRKLMSRQPGVDQDLQHANTLIPKVLRRLAYTHSTGLESAAKILKTGAVLSLDELVRRQDISPETKATDKTLAATDGLIGEQDAVFLEIRDQKNIQLNRFGDVSFVFDASIVDDGYFSPFSYTTGLDAAEEGIRENIRSFPELIQFNERLAAEYRHFVFKGRAALSEFLQLSVAESIHLQALKKKEFPALQSLLRKTDPGGKRRPEPYLAIVHDLLHQLGQNDTSPPEEFLRPMAVKQMVLFICDCDPGINQYGDLYSVFDAYKGLPMLLNGHSPVFETIPYEFIELKIPRQVPLSKMRQVLVLKSALKGAVNATKKAAFETALANYAQSAGRAMDVTDHGDWLEYDFKVVRQ